MTNVADLLTASQTARCLDLSVSRVRQLAEAGQLECVATPYGRLFSQEAVRAFADERQQRQAIPVAP